MLSKRSHPMAAEARTPQQGSSKSAAVDCPLIALFSAHWPQSQPTTANSRHLSPCKSNGKMLPNKLNDLHVTERDAHLLHVANWIEETHWKWLPLHGHHQMAPAIGAKHDQRNLVFLGRRDSSSQNDGSPGADHPMMSRKGLRGWPRKTKGRSVWKQCVWRAPRNMGIDQNQNPAVNIAEINISQMRGPIGWFFISTGNFWYRSTPTQPGKLPARHKVPKAFHG